VNDDGSIFDEAKKMVHGPKQEAYDHPVENFTRIGNMWAEVFGHPVTPEQVALCMVLVKVAREAFKPNRENRVDLIGYGGTLERIYVRRHDDAWSVRNQDLADRIDREVNPYLEGSTLYNWFEGLTHKEKGDMLKRIEIGD
jgi:hypothetical protein